MRYHTPSIDTELVRAVVKLWGLSGIAPAMAALQADLARVDAEEAKLKAEEDREVARKSPALSVQKVLGILRRAKLEISRYDSRTGADDGISVTYGDYERTWIKVAYSFSWNFDFNHNLRDTAAQKAKVKLVETQLFTAARLALAQANLQVSAHNDPHENPHLSYLRVQP